MHCSRGKPAPGDVDRAPVAATGAGKHLLPAACQPPPHPRPRLPLHTFQGEPRHNNILNVASRSSKNSPGCHPTLGCRRLCCHAAPCSCPSPLSRPSMPLCNRGATTATCPGLGAAWSARWRRRSPVCGGCDAVGRPACLGSSAATDRRGPLLPPLAPTESAEQGALCCLAATWAGRSRLTPCLPDFSTLPGPAPCAARQVAPPRPLCAAV